MSKQPTMQQCLQFVLPATAVCGQRQAAALGQLDKRQQGHAWGASIDPSLIRYASATSKSRLSVPGQMEAVPARHAFPSSTNWSKTADWTRCCTPTGASPGSYAVVGCMRSPVPLGRWRRRKPHRFYTPVLRRPTIPGEAVVFWKGSRQAGDLVLCEARIWAPRGGGICASSCEQTAPDARLRLSPVLASLCACDASMTRISPARSSASAT
jgi:hypothetical protein